LTAYQEKTDMKYVFEPIDKKRAWVVSLLIIAACLFAVGCFSETSFESEEPLPQNGVAKHELKQMGSCDDFLAYAKSAAIQRLTSYAELQKSQIENCWNWSDDTNGDVDIDTGADDEAGGDSDGDSDGDADGDYSGDDDDDTPPADDDQGEDDSHSDTNVQELGVDEPDLVKTDGDYIYTLTAGDLVLVQVGDNGALAETGRLTLGGYAEEIFIQGDLAVVFSAMQRDEVPESIRVPEPEWYSGYWGDYYYGGYEGYYYGDGYTQIAIVDMTNRSAPVVARNIVYAGSYVASRLVNDSVRAVVATATPSLDIPFGLNWYDYCEMPEEMGKTVFEAAYQAYIQEATKLVEALTVDDILPKKIDQVGTQPGSAEYIVECSELYGPETASGAGLLTVASIDLAQYQTQQTDIAVFGDRGLVYASTSSLYLTTSKDYVMQAWESGLWLEETSGIHKFDIAADPGKAIYKATGTVNGRMLNQFCLGEYNDYLRVATTLGDVWMPDTVDNQISILKEQDGELAQVGFLNGIAKAEAEEIYAARFMGDRGFLVTFRQTDPLFTFDLSDPANPKQVGKWQGPGYSTYLHPFGDNYLISVGEEDWRLALSLYDLTNFANPTLVQRYFPDENGEIYSTALSDHKAFTFYKYNDEDFMAFPFYGWAWDENYYYTTYSTGVILLTVGTLGFEERGRLNLNPEQDPYGYYNEGEARRGVFVNDTVFGISRCRVASANIANIAEVLDTLPLYTGDYCEDWGGGYDDYGGDIDVDADGDGDIDTDTASEPDYDTDSDSAPETDTESGDDTGE
jgi:hypothetical protein